MLRKILLATTVALAPMLAGACVHQATSNAPAATESAPAAPVAEAKPLYLDTTKSPEARAADLVARMTLEEKADQLSNFAPAIPRLGVPKYNWWNEGLHGVARADIATVFPQAIGMAASWDAPLMRRTADVISTEFRAKYLATVAPDGGTDWYRGLTVWSPNINIFRDPRWGRGQETYGEDPYLTGTIGTAFIQGLQGDHPTVFKTIATSKHYAVHSGPEQGRHAQDFHPTPRDLEETYLPAFRTTVKDGGAYSVMCAYNALYGVPACASPFLMEERLRQDWGFKGYVVSDCGAAANVYREDSLRFVKTEEEGVKVAFEAGMDLICGDYRQEWTAEQDHIVNAVNRGMLDVAVIDRALQRLFVARIRLGMFDPPGNSPYANITAKDYDTPAHNALSLEMAQASMVLLKNQGNLLPLKAEPKSIAVIGPNADSLDALIGNYYGLPSKPVTVLDGIRARFPNSKVTYVQGTGVIGPAEPKTPDAALCLDAQCARKGLKVEHFAGQALQGAATKTEEVANAVINWAGSARDTSARFTGYVLPPKTGEYRFRYASSNGYRIFVDDKLIVDAWGVGDAPSIAFGSAKLTAGKPAAIRVEARQSGMRGMQELVWSPPGDLAAEAVDVAKSADLVIYVAGLTARVEGEEMDVDADGFHGGDRTKIDLPAPQEALMKRLHATGKPMVLVLMSGSAVAVNWADKNVPAIVQAWYPGGQGGTAVAGLIAGDYSPSGRLPVTFYRSLEGLPGFLDYSMANRTYRYHKNEVLYPFGYGLSYSSFAYGTPKVSSASVKAGEPVTVSVDVTNTGAVDAHEVVQLYLSWPGVDGAPIRSLKRYERVHLARGEKKTVTFTLDDRAMSLADAQGVRAVRPGKIELWVGGGQPVSRPGLQKTSGASAAFNVTGAAVALPK